MNPQIFREYDIRGIVGQDLTAETVALIGKALGTYVRREGGKTLTLGWDIRASSVEFREIITRALNATGCDVIDIGRVPTPVSYFSLHHLNPDAGVMITGSHNPPEFNGFKISHGVHSLYGEKIQLLKGLIDKNDFETGNGSAREENVLDAYMEKIVEVIRIERPLKVVVDGGNGCFGIVGPQLLRKLGLEPIEQFCEPDGSFPNHHPDPTVPEYMEDLMSRVASEKADLGIGFDGDADRLGVVDDQGNLLWGDQLLILFAREILKTHPGTAVVGEVKCSQNLYDDVKKHGGQPVMSAAGHSLIKKKMKETGALLAGEMSGHMCFKDNYYGFDDAIFAACRVLEIVAAAKGKLSDMLSDLPQTFNTPEIRVDCPDDLKFRIVQELTEYFRSRYDVVDIDGVRIQFENGWGLIRASNTQPVLVLRFEAKSESQLKEYREIVAEQLKRYQPHVTVNI
ncbi:MAG: phosphomannomutase [Nitrospinaceae bacterium]|nr:phosphomannomutase/phosphoglucomutase [Nitrospinaceae bacterium]NIR55376.1 phosphomannomutase/phosphoglucomutase [Nitrospinaceae bacterium]NIS85813.1 phosphomannomutase/phosphoglucomutase [Nitrospinaceae bacterium]NIT82662.1 phosphomannomutase/phosphoglucomutase [Nitrospinaceae bacterium]NIU44870.1 phosphomannomutase/phosphoglucomutase [Nitrospinaceae bacterium]